MISYAPVIQLEHARADAEPWPKPRSLAHPAPPKLDLGKCIPPGLARLRDFCEATAANIQAPHDYVTPMAVAIASAGTARALEIEQRNGHRETAPLWFVCLGLPSERKSGVLSVLSRPLVNWQEHESAYLKHALAQYDEKRRGVEAQLSGIRDQLKRASGPAIAELQAKAFTHRATLENMPELLAPSLSVSTATPEGIRDGLIRNGEKMIWLSDEANEDDLLGKRYGEGGGGDIDLPCKAYSGMPHTVGRAKNQTHDLKRPALALAIYAQPGIFKRVITNREANDKGFIARLCPIHPESVMGTRQYYGPPIPADLLAWWESALRGVLDLPWPGRVVLTPQGPARSEKPARIVRMSTEAENLFCDMWNRIELRLGPDGDLRPASGFAGKLPAVIARIALVLEALQDPAAECITAETMKAACEWEPFLIEHFRFVMGDAAESEELKLARKVLVWLKREEKKEASFTEIQKALDGGGCLKKEEFVPAMELLVDFEWVRELPRPEGKPGRPSQRYTVNPATLT